ncbi:hypothetical protein LTR84_003865 [Exophiala bonariae]|uniref:Transcription factor domain-containing protein n=1 Tax=Exophiala bonariae TaxID=1690606 RepID=A0AAV9N8I9_9EURO|nr:hypothetical protein LTR84_003865 [Exophiala bonariae]
MVNTTPSPVQVLPGGSSDPFSAQGILITPRINQLITFIRDAYLPGIYITSFVKQLCDAPPRIITIAEGFKVMGRRNADKAWISMKEELNDEGRALAWAGSYATVMARYCSKETAREIAVMGLSMKIRSISILKDKLSALRLDSQPDIAVLAQIVSLFRASCKERDLTAAKVHAEIIRRLFNRITEGTNQIRTLFLTLISNDTEVAVSHMRRPFFNFETWVPHQLSKFWWSRGEPELPIVSLEYLDLDSSICMSSTRTACIRLRRYLAIRKTPINLHDPVDFERCDAIFSCLSTYSMFDLGVLVSAYLDLSAANTPTMSPAQRYAEESFALTTLYLHRWGIHQATVYGGDHRDSMHLTIIGCLRTTMKNALRWCSPQDMDRYKTAFLWVFFYGARYEYRNTSSKLNFNEDQSKFWFSQMFARQARSMGLTAWAEIEEVLCRFVFYDFLERDPKSWFEETMFLFDIANEFNYDYEN